MQLSTIISGTQKHPALFDGYKCIDTNMSDQIFVWHISLLGLAAVFHKLL